MIKYPMAFIEAAKLSDLKIGNAKHVKVKNKEIAIYNVNGKIYATDNACLHHKGPLGEGQLNNNIISCPWHGWQYDITNGNCNTVPGLKLKTYKVKIDKEKIMIDI